VRVKTSDYSRKNVVTEEKVAKLRRRMVLTAGMGFFTDAYDLFIIGVVTAVLSGLWHLSPLMLSVLNGASLASAAFGAVVFGWLSDKFGRQKVYGIEVMILFFGALASAASFSFIGLLIARIVVGFGIGGDYPSSAVVASECSDHQNRGYIVLMVFAMQALGLIVGPAIASLLLALHIPSDILWRVLIGLGAVPAAFAIYLRRTFKTSSYKTMNKEELPYEVSRVVSDLVGFEEDKTFTEAKKKDRLFSRKWWPCLLGTAGGWFLLDVIFYGNGISSVMIISALDPKGSLLSHTLWTAFIFLCFAVPGYLLSAKFIDRIGRKPLQRLGFMMIGVCFVLLAFVPEVKNHLYLFMAIFGTSFFFINFGPNATTFLVASEVYPANIRARAHGMSAAIGKVGAFFGAFILPPLLKGYGLDTAFIVMAVCAVLGVAVTQLIPEMKGRELL
jgi:PHS family inorganic phosphate transporter-like MFS transporter